MQGGTTRMVSSDHRKHTLTVGEEEKVVNQNKQLDKYKGYLKVNDEVVMHNGRILHNEFSVRIENSEASQWVIMNESEVKSVIVKRFREFGVLGGNVEDCFDMIIYEFNTRPELQFNKNYFGKDSSYHIREYILNRIKYMVQHYRNNLNDKHDVVPFINNEETKYHVGKMEETMSSNTYMETSEAVIETDNTYWDSIYDSLIETFKDFVGERSYREFDHKGYINYMYLLTGDFKRKNDLEEHYHYVAEYCGESIELIRLVSKDIVDSVKMQDADGLYMLEAIQELVKGKSYGWMPKSLRVHSGQGDTRE